MRPCGAGGCDVCVVCWACLRCGALVVLAVRVRLCACVNNV